MGTSMTGTTSFWKRPEGTAGKIIMAGLALAGIGVLYKLLPILISVATNVIVLGGLVAFIVAVGMVFTSDWFKANAFYVLQSISRAITSMFVDIDPVAILKTFLKYAQTKLAEIDESIKSIMVVGRKLDSTIEKRERQLEDYARQSEAAMSINDEDAITGLAEMAGGAEQDIRQYKEQREVINETLSQLERVKNRAKWRVRQAETDMERLSSQNEMAIALQGATDSAQAVLAETGNIFDIKNMAADNIKNKYEKARGELEGLSYLTRDLGKEIELGRISQQAEGRKKLEELRQRMNLAERVADPDPVKTITAGMPAFKQVGQGQAATQSAGATETENRWARRIRGEK